MRSKRFLTAEQTALDWSAPGLCAGVDEAGRGPLAGPVVAAAVILDELQPIRGLADSKTLSPRRRERLHDEIRAKALCVSVAEASVEEIDRLNILQATMLAMRRAVQQWLDARTQDPGRIARLEQRFAALHQELRRDTPRLAADAIRQILA